MPKIYIETQGCSHNQADSEHMAGLLQQAQYELVQDAEDADLVLLNTCTVKTPAEKDFFRRLHELENNGKKLVIGGCIPQTDPEKLQGYSLIGTYQLDKIVDVVAGTFNGAAVRHIERNGKPQLNVPKVRKNDVVEIVPINIGCMSACTFCKTKAARGNLQSYPVDEIIKGVREASSDGVSEIWLTSQDTGCYGFDIGTTLPGLLQEILQIENKDFRIRVGMGNPQHFLKILDAMCEVLQHEKVFKFLHIPVQAGNDGVLKAMKRGYTVEEFKAVVEAFRRKIPNITISTDIICGFPGETEEQFQDTVKLIQEVQPEVVNVSRFWARPKTAAERMGGQLSETETKRRSTIITELFRTIALEKNKKWVGWEGEILIDEKGTLEGTWIGRNDWYKQVVVAGELALGQRIKVKITDATKFDLRGEVTDQ